MPRYTNDYYLVKGAQPGSPDLYQVSDRNRRWIERTIHCTIYYKPTAEYEGSLRELTIRVPTVACYRRLLNCVAKRKTYKDYMQVLSFDTIVPVQVVYSKEW